MSHGALERVIAAARARRSAAAERCDLCGVEVPQQHRHLLDANDHAVMCVCQACALLFTREAASEHRYRLIPQRRVRLQQVPTKALGVPVGLAFFVPHDDGTVVAHYPSPAGATQWEVDPSGWRLVTDRCPVLGSLQSEVEALLVNTVRERRHRWIVPIDDCFRLVAVVRREWRGLSGGSRVWPEIDGFFDSLVEQ